jgi:hypothetical protein
VAGDERERIELDYAWGWFQYHASQRLTAFNFFLVIVGFLLVGYAQAVDHHWQTFGIGLGAFGALVALGFLVLDVRNEELVLRGQDALKGLEATMWVSLTDPDGERPKLPRAITWGRRPGRLSERVAPKAAFFVRHKFWLRLITFLAGIGFALAAAWAICDYPGSGSDPVTCRESSVFVLHRPGFDLSLVRRSEREGARPGHGDDSGRPGDGLSGEVRIGSIRGRDRKLVENGQHCDARP